MNPAHVDPLDDESPEQAKKTQFPSLISAKDLCGAPPATPEILIDGALYRGGTLLMAGPSKAAKSWTMMDLALGCATGGEWLGFKTAQTPVVYVNFELPAHVVHKRIVALTASRGISPPANLHFLNLRGRVANIVDLERELPHLIQCKKAGLIIIDPHYKISASSGMEENSNDDQGILLYRLESLASANNAAIAVAHHFAKGQAAEKNAIDRASGGGVFARWPDAFMALTPHEVADCMTLDFILRAFPPVPASVVRWNFPRWERDSSLDPTKLKRTGRGDEHPSSVLLEKLTDGMSAKEWREAIGWSSSTFDRKRDGLLKSGQVRSVSGQYYRN